jgi:hypothetical protein
MVAAAASIQFKPVHQESIYLKCHTDGSDMDANSTETAATAATAA